MGAGVKSRAELEAELDALRREVEALRLASPALVGESGRTMAETLHNLQVHQEELRTQNDQLRQAQDDIERVGQRYRDLFEYSPVGYFILNGDLAVVDANITAMGMLRRTKGRVAGKPFLLFVGKDDRPGLDAHFRQVRADGRASTELWLLPDSGDPIPVMLESVRLGEGWGGGWHCLTTAQDITGRRRAEAAVRDSEARFRAIFEQSPLAIQIVGGDLVPRMSNQAWVKLWGRASTVEGWPVASMPGAQRLLAEGQAGRAAELPAIRVPFAGEPDGERWVHGYGYPIQATCGAAPEVVLVHEDITARKRVELALARSNAELEQFAYVASHDLRQPLRQVSSYVSLLERRYGELLGDEGREFIAFARDGATRMDRLIVDLLELSRIGRDGKPMGPVSLTEVVGRSVAILGEAIAEAGARIEVMGDLPTVRGDAQDLVRLFQNLIGNSVKYRLPERPPVVTISACCGPASYEVTVQDNGIGIAPEHFDAIFGVFKRLHTAAEYEGTGIGLAICKKVVDRHHGRIWVESSPGEGTAFRLELPGFEVDEG